MKLIIANKNHSSWSLRPWLLMKQFDIPFEEVLIPFGQTFDDPEWKRAVSAFAPAGKVPALVNGQIQVWESLAIIDHLADTHPDLAIWPREPAARAMALSVAAEMHAGFSALRSACPMNFAWVHPPRDRGPKVEADIARIATIWRDARERFGSQGPFLFGAFSAADAMFAPVVARFAGYSVALDPVCAAYAEAVQATEGYDLWRIGALAEPWIIAEDEAKEPVLKDFRPFLSRDKT